MSDQQIPGEGELIDGFAELYARFLPRIAARMVALMTIDGGELASSDFVRRLGISPASVSSMSRRLIELELVERRIDPDTRRDLFRVRPEAWAHPWSEARENNLQIVAWADKALALVDGNGGDHTSLRELRTFATFIAAHLPALYEQYRAANPLP